MHMRMRIRVGSAAKFKLHATPSRDATAGPPQRPPYAWRLRRIRPTPEQTQWALRPGSTSRSSGVDGRDLKKLIRLHARLHLTEIELEF